MANRAVQTKTLAIADVLTRLANPGRRLAGRAPERAPGACSGKEITELRRQNDLQTITQISVAL